MPQLIEWSEEFQDQLRRIDQKSALRILEGIARLVLSQHGDVMKLQDVNPPEYRLRIGEYRVLFRKKGKGIFVYSVSTRQNTPY